jgi:hypothetical protein
MATATFIPFLAPAWRECCRVSRLAMLSRRVEFARSRQPASEASGATSFPYAPSFHYRAHGQTLPDGECRAEPGSSLPERWNARNELRFAWRCRQRLRCLRQVEVCSGRVETMARLRETIARQWLCSCRGTGGSELLPRCCSSPEHWGCGAGPRHAALAVRSERALAGLAGRRVFRE